MFTIMRQCVMRKTQVPTSKIKVTIRGQRLIGGNKGAFRVRSVNLSIIKGFWNNLPQTFTMIRQCVMRKTQIPTSKVKVTLRGQRFKRCILCFCL